MTRIIACGGFHIPIYFTCCCFNNNSLLLFIHALKSTLFRESNREIRMKYNFNTYTIPLSVRIGFGCQIRFSLSIVILTSAYYTVYFTWYKTKRIASDSCVCKIWLEGDFIRCQNLFWKLSNFYLSKTNNLMWLLKWTTTAKCEICRQWNAKNETKKW